MAQVFVEAVAENRGVTVEHILDAFGKGDVLLGKAAVAAGMADEVGTFETTLAGLAAGYAPARRTSASKCPTPRVRMRVAPVPAPKVRAARPDASARPCGASGGLG